MRTVGVGNRGCARSVRLVLVTVRVCVRTHRCGRGVYVGAHVLRLCFEWYASTIVSCYFALIISASSFVHAAASFVGNEDNMPQIPCYTHMAVRKRERERRGCHIKKKKKASTCNSLSVSVILGLFLIFLDKWALKAFSQMSPLFRPLNDNPGLWTCLQQLSTESMWSILSLNEADVQWDGKCPDIHQVREIRRSLGKNQIGEPGRAGSCSSWMVAGRKELHGFYCEYYTKGSRCGINGI